MSTLAIEQRLTELWERPKTVKGWFETVDHKDLGIRYVVTAFVFLLVGGLEALLMSHPARTFGGLRFMDNGRARSIRFRYLNRSSLMRLFG